MKKAIKIFGIGAAVLMILMAITSIAVARPSGGMTRSDPDIEEIEKKIVWCGLPVPRDLDDDGILDEHDPDIDGDGIPNEDDPWPYDPLR